MTARRGLFVQQLADDTGTSAKDARLAFDGSKSRNTSGDAEVGVLVDGMGPVVTGTGAMSYSVRACVVRSKHSTANGTTDSANDSAVTVATTAAPGTNSRIDAIYAVQRLDSSDGGNTANDNAFLVGVVQGAVSGSPSAPLDSALPQGALRLANVTVSTNATSTAGLTFTQVHEWVTSNGGIVPTAKGSRLGRVWDGTRRAVVQLGLIVKGQSDTVNASAYTQHGFQPVTTNAGGYFTITLEQAYASAILGANLTPNDISAQVVWVPGGTSGLNGRVFAIDTGAPAPGITLSVSYTVWGY